MALPSHPQSCEHVHRCLLCGFRVSTHPELAQPAGGPSWLANHREMLQVWDEGLLWAQPEYLPLSVREDGEVRGKNTNKDALFPQA